jgi:flavin reductase (DIM6/NTAB) family NADH-FMN oxidoreductase RutF
MRTVNPLEVLPAVMQQLPSGAFLTVAANDRQNVMTIGWGLAGILWQKPVLLVAVRTSRHTFGVIEAAEGFTVSVPTTAMTKELEACGTLSGRTTDKFKACRLATRPATTVNGLVIAIPGYHYECRQLYKNAMDPRLMEPALEALYPKRDYHTLYFGEIVACYQTD